MSTSAPDDLVDVPTAATMAERSPTTVRRWVREGRLTRHEGAPPEGGGHPIGLVSVRELLAHLATSGQQPRQTQAEPASSGVTTSDHAEQSLAQEANERASIGPDLGAHSLVEVQLADLRGQLTATQLRGEVVAAQLRAELATVRAERDALEARLADQVEHHAREIAAVRGALREALAAAQQTAADTREDLAAWRARALASDAELAAVRTRDGLPWWRRLLPGPTAPAVLPEAK